MNQMPFYIGTGFFVLWIALAIPVLFLLKRTMKERTGWLILETRFAADLQSPRSHRARYYVVAMKFNHVNSSSAVTLSLYENGMLLEPKWFFSLFMGKDLFIPFADVNDFALGKRFWSPMLTMTVLDQKISVRGPAAENAFALLQAANQISTKPSA